MAAERARVLAHVDMDAFFASVEALDHPEYVGRELLVGGDGPRGVVASCSYEARARGVHNAMGMGKAKQLCSDPIVVRPRISRYAEVSREVMAVLGSFSAVVEPLGLDEAYLDLSGVRLDGRSLDELGHEIRNAMAERTGLRCGVGIGRTRVLAKLASKAAKPKAGNGANGVVVVDPAVERAFLAPMALRELPGVGPVLAGRLSALGFNLVSQVQGMEPGLLAGAIGDEAAARVLAMAEGRDSAELSTSRVAKSVGHEETYEEDIYDREVAGAKLARMADLLSGASLGDEVARTLTVKARFSDFSNVTRSSSRPEGWRGTRELREGATELLSRIPETQGIRLLGISLSNFEAGGGAEQLSLLGDDADRSAEWRQVAEAVAEVRERFGRSSLGPGRSASR